MIVDARTQVLLMVPVFQSVYPRAFEAFLRVALNAAAFEHARYNIVPTVVARTLLHSAMNQTVLDAIDQKFDVLIFADDDCLPPIDGIRRLLRHYEAGRDFVAGMGFMRSYPHTTTAGRYYPEGPTLTINKAGAAQLSGFYWVDDAADEPPLMPVDFCGFPIAMARVSALARITRPWFGTALPLGECTHDVYFGEKAKQAGIALYVDTTLVCDHLTDQSVITPATRTFARACADAIKAAAVPK